MFTGIIKNLGKVIAITEEGLNKTFRIESELSPSLQIDQSVAHNGICLTVIKTSDNWFDVTAIHETLNLTTSSDWQIGKIVNLECATIMNTRLDGHIVQGHVDTTGQILDKQFEDGSWRFTFLIQEQFAPLIISKGSICIDGVSLTVINPTRTEFSVAIIPYTYDHTAFHSYKIGDSVNLEFDMIGKYILRSERLKQGLY